MNRRILISLIVGGLISGLGLYLAFRNVPFAELYRYIVSIHYVWVLPAMLVILVSFALRAVRWRMILSSSHTVSLKDAFHPLMIGFMINSFLPGRMGELARPVIIQQRNGVPFSTAIATVAAERVFDMLMLLGLFAWLLADMDFTSATALHFGDITLDSAALDRLALGIVQLTVLLIAGIVMITIPPIRNLFSILIKALPGIFFFLKQDAKQFIHDRICMGLIRLMENIASGFSLVRYPGKLLICTGLTALIWLLLAWSYYLVSLGCPGISLSFIEISVVMIIICFFIALPSVPGYWGIWEAGGVFGLTLYGIDAGDAAGFTLVNHAVQMFPVVITGLVSAALISINIRQFSTVKKAGN